MDLYPCLGIIPLARIGLGMGWLENTKQKRSWVNGGEWNAIENLWSVYGNPLPLARLTRRGRLSMAITAQAKYESDTNISQMPNTTNVCHTWNRNGKNVLLQYPALAIIRHLILN